MRVLQIILDVIMLVMCVIYAMDGARFPIIVTAIWVLIALIAHIVLYKEDEK